MLSDSLLSGNHSGISSAASGIYSILQKNRVLGSKLPGDAQEVLFDALLFAGSDPKTDDPSFYQIAKVLAKFAPSLMSNLVANNKFKEGFLKQAIADAQVPD